MRLKRFVFHPVLWACYPVLALYAHNMVEVRMDEILLPGAVVVGYALALWLILGLVFRNIKKAGLFVSLFLFFFFSYGQMSTVLQKRFEGGLGAEDKLWLPVWLVIFLVATYWVFKRTVKKRNLDQVTKLFNLVSLGLVLLVLGRIGNDYLLTPKWQGVTSSVEKEGQSGDLLEQENLPDIYYLIFDRYASLSSLRDYYRYDNGEFVDFLATKGFYVVNEGWANYPITDLSLASSLNMEYLDYLSQGFDKNWGDFQPFHDRITEAFVFRFLKEKDYLLVNVGSEWWLTKRLEMADINYERKSPWFSSEFTFQLLETTMLYPFVAGTVRFPNYEVMDPLTRMATHRDFILFQLDKLTKIPKTPQPKFVFAHILLPHEPYVFGREAEFLRREVVLRRERRENYLNQLIGANKLIKEMVEGILKNTEGKAVIVLQADEGPLPRRFKADEYNFDWTQATVHELKEKLGILNAYYLPGVQDSGLYAMITPVNTFRLIFNLYFETDYQIVPDRIFVTRERLHPHDQIDVTDKLKN